MKLSAGWLAVLSLALGACSKTPAPAAAPVVDELALVESAVRDARSWHVTTSGTMGGQSVHVEEDVVCPFDYHRIGVLPDRPGLSAEVIQTKDHFYQFNKDQDEWFALRATAHDHCAEGPSAGGMPLLRTLQNAKGSTTLRKGELRDVAGAACRNWDVIQQNNSLWASLCIDDDTNLPRELRATDITFQYTMWNRQIPIPVPDVTE
jgi:hypothetical protein